LQEQKEKRKARKKCGKNVKKLWTASNKKILATWKHFEVNSKMHENSRMWQLSVSMKLMKC